MPIISGGGGALKNPITVSVPLEIDQTDATKNDLLLIKIPATYVNDSNQGWLVRAAFTPSSATDFVFAAGLDTLHFTAATGEGAGKFLLNESDGVGSQVSLTTRSGYQGPGVSDKSIVSGAYPTFQAVTATYVANPLGSRDIETHTPVTFNPTAIAASTCKVELSPDGITLSTLCIWTEPIGAALAGTIHDISVRVPSAGGLKFTVTNAVLGLTTYY